MWAMRKKRVKVSSFGELPLTLLINFAKCLFLASLFHSVNPEGDRTGVASSMLWIE